MAAANEVSGQARPPATGTLPDDRPLTLSEEHGLLLRQVAVRVEDLLEAIAEDRWPTRELAALLAYLREEVLRQAADEERLLFPARHNAGGVAGLVRDHTDLRLAMEALVEAATDGTKSSSTELAMTARDLLSLLERHLSAEEEVLAPASSSDEAPGTTALTRRPHEWYSLTECPTIDLDALPESRVVDAVVDRLLRLRGGEGVELHSRSDPYAVWQRMNRLRPGDFRFVYLQAGPRRWCLQITRRVPVA